MKILEKKPKIIELLMKKLVRMAILNFLNQKISMFLMKKKDSRMNQKELIMKVKDSSKKHIEKMLKM